MLSSGLIGVKWEKSWDGLQLSTKDETQAGAVGYSAPIVKELMLKMQRNVLHSNAKLLSEKYGQQLNLIY